MTENEVMKEDRAEKLRQEHQTKEREVMKKNHLEALISEWKFQCAEGIYTYPRERMFEICYTDAYEQGRKEATRELQKQIQIDTDLLELLQKQNGELTDKVKELEAQIEKMKCCGNCSHYKLDNKGLYPIKVCELTYSNRCKNHDKWEIKEK